MTVNCEPDQGGATLVLSRAFGADLVISGDCPPAGGGVWFNRLELPAFGLRTEYAPPSRFVPGNVLLGAVVDASVLPVTIVVAGEDRADLQERQDVLADVLFQWRYRAAVVIDGEVVGDWLAQPTVPVWSGALTRQYLRTNTAQAVLTIPVQPYPVTS